jgi:hypothetical protein
MKNLMDYKILKYEYPYTSDMLGEILWEKMTDEESEWALFINVSGINDTGDSENGSWDLFFINNNEQERIERLLRKYKINFIVTDQTNNLLESSILFGENFMKKLNKFLNDNITVDEILDNIIEIGIENISEFERYYLDNNKENN